MYLSKTFSGCPRIQAVVLYGLVRIIFLKQRQESIHPFVGHLLCSGSIGMHLVTDGIGFPIKSISVVYKDDNFSASAVMKNGVMDWE